MTEMIISKTAGWFASILLLLGAAAGQQTSAAESQASRQASSFESQSAPCQPQATSSATPFDTCKYSTLGPGIRPPKAVNTVNPTYPEPARKAKLNGTVVVAVAINEKGRVDDVKIVRSSDRNFEQSAIDAAKKWIFLPALKDGKPVAVQINIEMGFNLY